MLNKEERIVAFLSLLYIESHAASQKLGDDQEDSDQHIVSRFVTCITCPYEELENFVKFISVGKNLFYFQ